MFEWLNGQLYRDRGTKQPILQKPALFFGDFRLFYRDRSMNALRIAELVKQHRRAAGLSQAQLAALAGVGKTAVFEIEHGKETVRLNVLLKVLGALNIELSPSSPLLKADSSNLQNHAAS